MIKPSRGAVLIGTVGNGVCAFLLAVFVPVAGLFLQSDMCPEFGIVKCNDVSGLVTSRWLMLHRLK